LATIFLLAIGLVALALAAWKKAWASALLAILGVQIGLSILARIGTVSFSVNASLLPLLASEIFVLFAPWLRAGNHDRLAWFRPLKESDTTCLMISVRDLLPKITGHLFVQ